MCIHCPFSVTAGLWRHAEVGVEVGVADDLVVAHPLARGVDDVDEERVTLTVDMPHMMSRRHKWSIL